MKYIALIIITFISLSGYSQTISGGNDHSTMLCGDSLVWAVGSNTAGQLGDGTTVNKLTPIEVNGITGIISIGAGLVHTVALKNDGSVWAWGKNQYGQLGDNTTITSLIPVEITNLPSDIIRIVVGGYHNIAIASDSTTWLWGSNQFDQIDGSGLDKLIPIQNGSNILDIAAGENYTSRLYVDSTVRIENSGTKFLTISSVISLGSGFKHCFIIKSDNTIWVWGDNQYGQLGDGTTISQGSTTVVQVIGLSNVISIKGGQRHSMALKSDGTVWTWGWNGMGQLGDSTLIDQLTPIQVPGLDSVVEIATGSHHCMARRSDSSIWVWGSNISGQLGNDTAINTTVPVQMMLSCQYQCPAPQVYQGNDLTICSGDSVEVFGNYQTLAGMYYDSLLTPNSCDSIIEITLTVNTPPTVSFTGLDTTYCNINSFANLIGTPSGGSFSGTGVLGSVFNPLSAGLGTHTITYTYNDGTCTVIESQSTVVTNCTGINEVIYNDFKIYPNPSTGIVNIETDKRVQINNTLGQTVYEGISNQIDLSGYGKGVYFVKVGAIVKKLIITNSNIR